MHNYPLFLLLYFSKPDFYNFSSIGRIIWIASYLTRRKKFQLLIHIRILNLNCQVALLKRLHMHKYVCAYMFSKICVHEYLLAQCPLSFVCMSNYIVDSPGKLELICQNYLWNQIIVLFFKDYTLTSRNICYIFIKGKENKIMLSWIQIKKTQNVFS